MKNTKLTLTLIFIFILEILILGFIFFFYIPRLLFAQDEIESWQIIITCLLTLFSSIGLNIKFYKVYENLLCDKKESD
jgi:uncharacterized membrane protein